MEKMVIKDLSSVYKDKKVLVTGNTGFKGGWLSLWLTSLGAKVFGYANEIPTNPSFYDANGLGDIVSQYWGDIRDEEGIGKAVNEIAPDFIFHLAAQPLVKKSVEFPIDTFTTNGIGTAVLLEVIRKTDFPCTVVLITSDKCYENVEWIWGYKETDRLGGKDPYSASKAIAEIVFHSYFHTYFEKRGELNIATTRAGNVIGGGDWAENRIVPDCIKNWVRGEKVLIRRPHSTRPWQHVLEPLGGYLLLGASLSSGNRLVNGESFNFGPSADQNLSVGELIQELAKNWEYSNANELITIENEPGFHEAGLLKLNTDKASALLNWRAALNFEQTVKMTSQWYDQFYTDKTNVQSVRNFSLSQIGDYINMIKG